MLSNVLNKITVVAVGSNLPGEWASNSYDMCHEAIKTISARLCCDEIKVSNWYQTSPIPPSAQPLYINGAIAFRKEIDPLLLLSILNEIEQEAGRVRNQVNEARPLDLDIISIGNQTIDNYPRLVVPHPRAHLRGFVLYPMRDLFPDWVHPILNRDVNELIAELPLDQIVDVYQPNIIE